MCGKQVNANKSTEDTDPASRHDPELQEGQDYYLEHGLLVFTAAFLRKRGYCCESGCRHCPYMDSANGQTNNPPVSLP
ncbi:MAG TPA: DUF5522 domain-containing protein [Pyrinomonadaceae bacterium]|nr:DUF5522 domain-containing protein [Pyrinomonadaceae bacterium]